MLETISGISGRRAERPRLIQREMPSDIHSIMRTFVHAGITILAINELTIEAEPSMRPFDSRRPDALAGRSINPPAAALSATRSSREARIKRITYSNR